MHGEVLSGLEKLDVRITPKGHGLEHALYQFQHYKGMSDLSEAFMEPEHQAGVKYHMSCSNNTWTRRYTGTCSLCSESRLGTSQR